MLTKELARLAPPDFLSQQKDKKLKRDYLEFRSQFNNFIKESTTSKFRSSFFNPTKMPQHSHKECHTDRKVELNLPESTSTENIDDDLDSLLQRLQSLNFETTVDIDTNKPNILNLKKEIIHTIVEPDLSDSIFDKLFDKTAIPTTKEIVEPLTDEENAIVSQLFKKGQEGEIAQLKTAVVSYNDIYRLYPETWLNDEVVNFYFQLLSDRAERSKESSPSIHCFSTFFYSALRDNGFNKVKRWTKRVDIFSKDLLFIPINQAYHWVLGVIDMRKKTVAVYDSLHGNHTYVLELFLEYLEQEHMDKKKTPYDTSDWERKLPKDIPCQGNMSDCGVFACAYAERLSQEMVINFSQKDMNLIRRRIALNIYKQKI